MITTPGPTRQAVPRPTYEVVRRQHRSTTSLPPRCMWLDDKLDSGLQARGVGDA